MGAQRERGGGAGTRDEGRDKRQTPDTILWLYIAGMTQRSISAIAAIKAICEERIAGNYELNVIDLYQKPWLARERQILAAPTLVRSQPSPARTMIGDLSDRERVLERLNLLVPHHALS